MSRWTVLVELDEDDQRIDQIRSLLVTALEATGRQPRTKTIRTDALEAALKPLPPMGKPPAQTTALPRARGVA